VSSTMREPRMMPAGVAAGSRKRSSEPALRWRSVSLMASSAFRSDALEHGALGLQRAGEENGGVKSRRDGGDVRQFAQARGQVAPVFDAAAGFLLEDVDMGHGAQQIALEGVMEAVVDAMATMRAMTPAATPTMEMAVMTEITVFFAAGRADSGRR